MNKKGQSYFIWIIILLCLTVGYAVQQNVGFDVNQFKSALVWTDINIPVESAPDLGNALTSLINGIGNATFSFLKWFADIAAQNPDVPWKLLIYLTFFAIFAPIIIFLFQLLIIIFILVKEYFQTKKDKRELEKYKK
uniref:Uncharacterized protein n=1 Tax=viral metagenome TaxID=1070528 RepID=A0A6M3JEW3_9ZZZZ